MPGVSSDPDLAKPLVRLLANGTNWRLISALEEGPSFPRQLAARLQITEGQAQKHLRRLAQAGLVEGHWHHEGKTVKQYVLRVRAVHLRFHDGHIESELDVHDRPTPEPRGAGKR